MRNFLGTASDNTGCNVNECSKSMSKNDLCEADRTLPDGNTKYNIDNCPGGYDVFRYIEGRLIFNIRYHLFQNDKYL